MGKKGPIRYKMKVDELDLPEDPCNPDPGYSFYTCVQKNTIKTVILNDYNITLQCITLFTRLDVEPSGATAVTRAHPFVVMSNSTGGIVTFLIYDYNCLFQNDGRLVHELCPVPL